MPKKTTFFSKHEISTLFAFLFILATGFVKPAFMLDRPYLSPPPDQSAPPVTHVAATTTTLPYGLGCIPRNVSDRDRPRPIRMLAGLPTVFDWTQSSGVNWMTSVKSQGQCGSCVAFGSIGALEAKSRIQMNNPSLILDLSEQHLFSCGGALCGTGWFIDAALNYIRNNGAPDESCFPYQASGGQNIPCSSSCSDWQRRSFKITGWHYSPSTDPADIQAELLNGPLVASFAVYGDFYYGYTGGIYHHTSGTLVGYHAVTIVGYDATSQYWKCKNSWGAVWGENGYFRIGFGECGIEQEVLALETVLIPSTTTTTTTTTTSSTTTSYITGSTSTFRRTTVTSVTPSFTTTYRTLTSTHYEGLNSTTYSTTLTLCSTSTSLSTATVSSSTTNTTTRTEVTKTGTSTSTTILYSTTTSGDTIYVNMTVRRIVIERFLERLISTITRWLHEITQIHQSTYVTEAVKEIEVRVEPELYPRGTTQPAFDISPKPGSINKPITVSGTLHGSWRPIKDGVVVSRPVEVTTGWGFTAIVNTDNDGRFSVTTNCPAKGGYYDVTVTFYEDVDLQGSSQTMSLQVLEYIETALSISSVSVQSGMGLATKFYGYLREKDTGRGIADKAIFLTVLGRGGYSFRYELRTDSRGYYEFIYTNNYGSFEWAEARFNGEGLYLASYSGRIYSR